MSVVGGAETDVPSFIIRCPNAKCQALGIAHLCSSGHEAVRAASIVSANIGEEIGMFSHVMIGTNDLEKAKSFYDVLLGTLGVPPGRADRHRIFYRTPTGVFSVSKPIDGKPATPANGGTVGFAASSAEQADAFHAAGIANGGRTCEEPPGVREGSGIKLYIAYLRDPDGNKLCALHRMVDPKTSK
jgi:catechol 2,3-dioxygenase-like lactoylglutathione lyase family enzyme